MDLDISYLMSNQQYVKNTNYLPREHPLSSIGYPWKISSKTQKPYIELANLTDKEVKKAATIESTKDLVSDNPTQNPPRDTLHYEIPTVVNGVQDVVPYWFWVSDFNGNGKFSVYAFTTEIDSESKKQEAIKYAGYSTNNTTQTKVTAPTNAIATTAEMVTKTPPLQTHQVIGNDVIGTLQESKRFHKTFEDPKRVVVGSADYIGWTEKGYSIITSDLCNPNFWVEPDYDDEGNLIGTNDVVLLGKIINVEIPNISRDD